MSLDYYTNSEAKLSENNANIDVILEAVPERCSVKKVFSKNFCKVMSKTLMLKSGTFQEHPF